MSEAILKLLLTNALGLSLPATLRYDYADPEAVVPGGALAALLAAQAERPRVPVTVVALAGTLSVPLLTGARKIALTGAALVTPAAPITTLLRSASGAPPITLHFNPIDFQNLAGGLIWRAGQLGEQVFSLLGRPAPAGLDELDMQHRSDQIADAQRG